MWLWIFCCLYCNLEVVPSKFWEKMIFKDCVFILTCLNFSHLQSTLHLMKYTYQDVFSTPQNSVWTHWFWCLLVLLLFFVSSFLISKTFCFEDIFHPGKQTKSHSGWDWVNRKDRAWGSCCFLVKNCSTLSTVWAGACKSPITKWANTLKESSTKICWSWMQPLSTTPAGALIQTGSQSTHPVGEAWTIVQGACPPEDMEVWERRVGVYESWSSQILRESK